MQHKHISENVSKLALFCMQNRLNRRKVFCNSLRLVEKELQ